MASSLRRRLHLPPHRRYPVWSPATVTLVGVVVAIGAASAVLLSLERPLVIQLEWTLAIIAACLFVGLVVGLYGGVRVRRERFAVPSMPSTREWVDSAGNFDVPDLSGAIDADEFGCLGAIVGLVLGFVAILLLIGLLVLVAPLAYGAVALVVVAVWWVCYLALRRTFALSRRCRGNLAASVGYALLFTLLYTGWLFAVLVAWQYVAGL